MSVFLISISTQIILTELQREIELYFFLQTSASVLEVWNYSFNQMIIIAEKKQWGGKLHIKITYIYLDFQLLNRF